MSSSIQINALTILKKIYGRDAKFRQNQVEAIEHIVKGGNLLCIQRTGWGKSIIYFIATKLLRFYGSGPTILISPLLSLIRNQEETAKKIGINVIRIDSKNRTNRIDFLKEIEKDNCDLILTTPESFQSNWFNQNILQTLGKKIGLVVIDEAHCISDWGHDFRPEYRQILKIIKSLSVKIPLLATIATANDRVEYDLFEQLGKDIKILRGSLMRTSFKLQVIGLLLSPAERFAWLAENIPLLQNSGIIYCLTKNDCENLANWLKENNIEAVSYHSELSSSDRLKRETLLIKNKIKVLVATIALGMGFDKPDLGFVIHYQRPSSVISYYQQIGRAGYDLEEAISILFAGEEDERINRFFIKSSIPNDLELKTILDTISEAKKPINFENIRINVNISKHKLEQSITHA